MDFNALDNNFSCINKMDEEHKKYFETQMNHYTKLMNTKTVVGGRPTVVYDFDHHCVNVYGIISQIIFDEVTVYNDEKGLSQQELYILNLAVLFHPISLFTGEVKKLCEYPSQSADYVKKEYENISSVLRLEGHLCIEESRALVDIIRVHNGSVQDENKIGDLTDLLSIKDRDTPGGTVRTKFLAGVLRLANKFDFTSARLGNDDSEQQLAKLLSEKNYPKEEETFLNSKWDFEKLHYISSIKRKQNRKQAILVIDDEEINSKLEQGMDQDDLLERLEKIHSDINEEFKAFKEAFYHEEYAHFVSLEEIVFETQINYFDYELKLRTKRKDVGQEDTLPSKKNTRAVSNKGKLVSNKGYITLISDGIAERLSHEVRTRNLLKFGHFRLDANYCARDWIDTRELVETEAILSEMVQHLIDHINRSYEEKDLIIGVDLVGSLLTSRIAFPLNCPMTYIIPSKVAKYDVKQDKEVDLSNYKKIIMVTDSIVSGETLMEIIKEYKLDEKIIGIYTMFYRKSKVKMCLTKKLLKKTYCLNDSYIAEVFEMKNCPYKEKKCMARNSRVY